MHDAGDTVMTKTDTIPALLEPIKWWIIKINVYINKK